jgi:hypothetical protein
MNSRSILFSRLAIAVLFAVVLGAESAYAFDGLIPQGKANEKAFEEKMDSLISKRMDLPLVRAKLEKSNGKFVPVYGSVAGNNEGFVDWNANEDLFDAESLFNVLNKQMMLRNEMLLKKASPEVRRRYNSLSNRFNFISLERIRIRVDYYYDRAKKKWTRPVAKDSVVTMTMIVKSGYFLYQDNDSLIDIRRYGYYMPSENVKRIFFGDGYSEVLWTNPSEAHLDSMRVLPYKLVEKIPVNKNIDDPNRKKIRKLLKERNFAYIPHVLQEMDVYCERNLCPDVADYKRYLNLLDVLYRGGILGRN